MRFASIGSGSRGNSLVVEVGVSRVLVDCGFSTRVTCERLGRLGLAAEDFAAVILTHEHSDHVAGAFRFAARFGIPVYLTHGTLAAMAQVAERVPRLHRIDTATAFGIGSIDVQPFPVPHDAREPVQFSFTDGRHRLGLLTDAGSITSHIVDRLQQCDALVLECNHDADLLASSSYPAALKRRILGALGHLANEQAAAFLTRVETQRLQHIVAAHLSERNNRPDLARGALAEALNCAPEWITAASQSSGFGWRELV